MRSTLFAITRGIAFPLAVILALGMAPSAVADREGEAPPAAESYKLPISPPRDQGGSDLCWAFATLSMLETNYRVRHPGSHIEFSRGALQRHAVADRLRRFNAGESRHLESGGLAVEAIGLIRDNGLVAESDYHDFVDPNALVSPVVERVAASDDDPALHAAIVETLGPIPAVTRLDGVVLTPAALGKAMLGGETWTEYDLAADGVERIGPSSDPDARPETRVRYVPLSRLVGLIHSSLKRGEAVVWGSTDHALLIFGADYDRDGTPLAYWVKDSEPPYISRTPAEDVHKVLTDVTVSDASVAAASN